ncbi:Acetamidase Formamidase [Favolaschia claudopus]|uniref:Acetamidase Formamidase n=1 Tax=Favolaschia claudopus TaxID=2862362 RepID=A0AAW0DWG0_9AGAR
MPAKYSHVKKMSAAGALKKSPNGKNSHQSRSPNPHADRGISQAMTAVSQLERAIARLLLLRYEQDIARLFSTRLYSIALVHLPTFVMRCAALAGPGWVAYNADADEIKDFFRAAISMDMRQAGERVATKSVLWSYTALRHFALSNNITICKKRGLHSMRLLPHYDALKTHLDTLEALPPAAFAKPPHLGSLQEGQDALEEACDLKYASSRSADWGPDWHAKVRLGYEKLSQTLWRVAREFDVRGYGMVLREKLTTKWCDCGCSTDHLGEVCERTVREDEEESGVRLGKQREWDGRGSGIYGWETEEEEDIWEIGLDFGGMDPEELEEGAENEMTIGELMEWRFIRAEREKEEGNVAFRKGDYPEAVKHYEAAHQIEPELPHYQLNLAAAYLKLSSWMEAEAACTKALAQHRSGKGYFRRARARKMLGRNDEAIRGTFSTLYLRAVLKLQPTNAEAIQELLTLLPPSPTSSATTFASSTSSSSNTGADASKSRQELLHERLGIGKPKLPKPLPFPRTRADDRKLRIVIVPAPAPGDSAQVCHHHHGHGHQHTTHSHSHGHACNGHHHHHHHHDGSSSSKGKGKGTSNAAEMGIAAATRREKEQALEAEMLKMLEAMRLDTGAAGGAFSVMLPSWDRYVVKRAESCVRNSLLDFMATQANSVPHPTLIQVPADQQKTFPGNPQSLAPRHPSLRYDWTGAQIGNNDTSDDIKNVDLSKVHNLSGPIAVEGAEPGDCLVVDILDVTPFEKMPWGYTGIFELTNGGGLFAREFDSKAAKAIWDLQGIYATSRHIPGVRFAGVSHPGLIGTAPSAELLATWNKREGELIAQHPNAVPAVAFAPNPVGAYVGQELDPSLKQKIAEEGARTIPGREHGGNCDIKNLSKGSRCYFPVFVKGANLSVGDLHFSQGDGELSFCGAIEMAGIITFSTSIIKDGIEKFALKQPIFLPSPIDPLYSAKVIFEGISVDYHGDGKQYNMDATVAYKQAALNAIAYLTRIGYNLLLSAAPIESHVGALVDSPNACVTLAIPTGIFTHDILPKPEGFTKQDFGQCAIRSDGIV